MGGLVLRIQDVKPGDVIVADEGFTCMVAGAKTVGGDSGGLYVPCRFGRHYLEGQVETADGVMIGFTRPGARERGECIVKDFSEDEKFILRALADGPKQSVGGSEKGPDRAKQALRRRGLINWQMTDRDDGPPIRMWTLLEKGRQALKTIGRPG